VCHTKRLDFVENVSKNVDILNGVYYNSHRINSDNSKPGENRGRKAAGLNEKCRVFLYDSRAAEEVIVYQAVCL
jgi:hypothetical protein